MKINYNCLPCLVKQAIKVAEITNSDNRDTLFKNVFNYLSNIDFSKTNPEIIGGTFCLIKEHIKNNDPYKDIRNYYNKLFLELSEKLEAKINHSPNCFEEAVKYSVIGNIIDFSPINSADDDSIMKLFDNAKNLSFTVNHITKLLNDIQSANTLLYLGDNCGEICLDKILIKKIKEINPNIKIYFGVKGKPVVNDSIEEDAYFVGIDKYADIISNGDDSLGTVLTRTNEQFNKIYKNSDVVISKGQANYECLSDELNKNIYFLLITKCAVISKAIGVEINSLLCMNKHI